jgi:hypothetical protein
MDHVKISLQDMDDAVTDISQHLKSKVPLMLILDVRTQWTSTHQMLCLSCYLVAALMVSESFSFKGVHMISKMSLTFLLPAHCTKASDNMSYQHLIGLLSVLSKIGSDHSVMPPLRCRQQNMQHFRIFMLSLRDCRMTSGRHSLSFHNQLLLVYMIV